MGIRWTLQLWKTQWSNVISPLALLKMLALVSEHNLSLSIIQSIFETWNKDVWTLSEEITGQGKETGPPLHKIFLGGDELATHRSPIVDTEERARAYLTWSMTHVNFKGGLSSNTKDVLQHHIYKIAWVSSLWRISATVILEVDLDYNWTHAQCLRIDVLDDLFVFHHVQNFPKHTKFQLG